MKYLLILLPFACLAMDNNKEKRIEQREITNYEAKIRYTYPAGLYWSDDYRQDDSYLKDDAITKVLSEYIKNYQFDNTTKKEKG